ncbi:hypothetical protein PJL15_03958 [Paenarthrobacter nitroguajacolicus]|nr:hypothetical protein [Paenarthrobacter nitroguajacolicus]
MYSSDLPDDFCSPSLDAQIAQQRCSGGHCPGFAARGVTVERVLSDNGSAYKSHLWRDTCRELNIKVKETRLYRPQTNGKIERFHRTLADGWAFKRFYATESARRNALPAWLHHYNNHRSHTAIGGRPPISRSTNLSGQYS